MIFTFLACARRGFIPSDRFRLVRTSAAISFIWTSPDHDPAIFVRPTWGSKLVRSGFVKGASLESIIAAVCEQGNRKRLGHRFFVAHHGILGRDTGDSHLFFP